MTSRTHTLSDHYGRPDLLRQILDALERAGADLDALTRDDTAPFDAFHIGGRAATRTLADLAGLRAGQRVLDLGCGVGGPARTLAAEYGCRVTGIDVVAAYCRTAAALTDWMGLGDRVDFCQGDVTALPFEEASFDVGWSQHATMNVADKARLFDEVRRVLRPGGRLVLYEICAGSGAPPFFPVPWADSAAISFLVAPPKLQDLLRSARLDVVLWQDVTRPALTWYERRLAASSADASPVGMHLLMGPDAAEKGANVVRSLEADRIRVVQGVAVAA